MKKSSWRFFVGIGILLIMAGAIVFVDDDIVGIIGIVLGAYNIFKGVRLAQGVQPILIRKQKESLKNKDKELKNKLDQSKEEQ